MARLRPGGSRPSLAAAHSAPGQPRDPHPEPGSSMYHRFAISAFVVAATAFLQSTPLESQVV